MLFYYDVVNIPANPIFPEGTRLLLLASENKMWGIYVAGQKHVPEISDKWEKREEDTLLQEATERLKGYFSGEQKQLKIPDTTTRTPSGQCDCKNPLLFLVPCHRIIGRNGTLRGFSAGLEVKKRLLDMERGHHVHSV